jgi:hypothetical protein
MIDFANARAIAESVVAESQEAPDHQLVIVDAHTIDDQLGWIFFTESDKFLRTGKFRDRLIGNHPIFVDRADGSVSHVPTYQSAETFLADYGRWRMANPPKL